MILAHYGHRLPATFDIGSIHDRARTLAPDWDDVPDMVFKAFLLRQRGERGALANHYSSLYLWRDDAAFARFVAGRFKTVTDMFGRPEIETRFALDARRGPGREARFAHKEQVSIPLDVELADVFAREIERNREAAARRGTIAAAVGVDTVGWSVTRVLVSEDEPDVAGGTAYEVLHLSRPLLAELPTG